MEEKTGNIAREGRPAYNTAPIRCGKLKCKWRGYEGELIGVASKRHGPGVTDKVCPICGTHGYYHMTSREIAAWERNKLAAGLAETAAIPAHAADESPRWLGRDVVLIQAVPVLRDETGNWWHPDMPPFDEGDGEKFKAWLKAQGLELSRAELGDEPEDHPAYKAVFEDANCDFSAWDPEPPAGAGWFMLAISDTEDGPACCWVRRAPPAAPAP